MTTKRTKYLFPVSDLHRRIHELEAEVAKWKWVAEQMLQDDALLTFDTRVADPKEYLAGLLARYEQEAKP